MGQERGGLEVRLRPARWAGERSPVENADAEGQEIEREKRGGRAQKLIKDFRYIEKANGRKKTSYRLDNIKASAW